ncbi:8280_t:CDS:2, partial [Paraglomus occultum]
STTLKRRIAYVEQELERQKKSRNNNSHIGTRILEDPETLDEEAVFDGIPWPKFLEFLIPLTEFDFHDTRNSPMCDPNAKIDFIIVRKNGYRLWAELVAVIEAKGDIRNTTSHKDAVGQICDRHMEILKQQRLRKVVFGIVLDCRFVEIIKTVRSSAPAFLHYRTGLFSLFAPDGTSNERGYALLIRLLRSSSVHLGFTPFVFPNPPYLFTKDGRDLKINKAIMLKEGYGNYPSICLGFEQRVERPAMRLWNMLLSLVGI